MKMSLNVTNNGKFKSTSKCQICKKDFENGDKRYRDHDYLTGK